MAPIGTDNDKGENKQKQKQEQAKANAGVLRFAQNDKRFMTVHDYQDKR
jgi:hypothetical protein